MLIEKLVSFLPTQKARDTALAVGGMAALVTGRKVVALTLFSKGVYGLEQEWRDAHPTFSGTWGDRWASAIQFYEDTHEHGTNRTLHRVGIPMIVGGAVGLFAFRPYRPAWFASATAFSAGWALNIVGHYKYEKRSPAFSDDPLSFLAGPVWDVQQMMASKKGKTAAKRAVSNGDEASIKGESLNVPDDAHNGVHAASMA